MNEFENNNSWENEDLTAEENIYETGEEKFTQEEISEEDNFFAEEKSAGFTVTHNITKKKKRLWPRVAALSLVAGIVFGP